MAHRIGSHNHAAHPDSKMSTPARSFNRYSKQEVPLTRGWKRGAKKISNAKRRRRDRITEEDT